VTTTKPGKLKREENLEREVRLRIKTKHEREDKFDPDFSDKEET
jgi:hypothetical protein